MTNCAVYLYNRQKVVTVKQLFYKTLVLCIKKMTSLQTYYVGITQNNYLRPIYAYKKRIQSTC